MQVRFKATEYRAAYSGNYAFTDGLVRNIEEAEAKRLVKDFPANFELVELGPDPEPEKAQRPKRNKIFKSGKDK